VKFRIATIAAVAAAGIGVGGLPSAVNAAPIGAPAQPARRLARWDSTVRRQWECSDRVRSILSVRRAGWTPLGAGSSDGSFQKKKESKNLKIQVPFS
jgi:hypothetical protein